MAAPFSAGPKTLAPEAIRNRFSLTVDWLVDTCEAVDQRVLAGVALGLVAVAVGGVALFSAVMTRRRRASIAATYAQTGGVAYSVLQFGCAGSLIILGLIVIGFVLLRSR